jgi:hypothetical protein
MCDVAPHREGAPTVPLARRVGLGRPVKSPLLIRPQILTYNFLVDRSWFRQIKGTHMPTRRLHHLRGVANENHRDPTNDEPLWIVEVGGGQLRLIRGHKELKELIANHGLAKTARAYMLSATSKELGEIAEVQSAFAVESDPEPAKAAPEPEDVRPEPPSEAASVETEEPRAEPMVEAAKAPVEPVRAEPSISLSTIATIAKPVVERGSAESPSLAHDAEFSLLDRPFDDGEFFEEPPRSRWLRGAGVVAVVALLGGGGYQLFHSRSGASSSAGGRAHESAPVAEAAPPIAEPAAAAVVPPPLPVAAAPVAPAAPIPAAAAVAPAAAPVAAVAAAVAPAAAAPPPPAPAAPVARVAAAPVAPASDPPPSAAPAERAQAPSRTYSELVAEGKRLFEAGRSRRAQASYEQALAETPDGTAALIGLAYVHLDRGKFQPAISLFRQALDQDRGNASAMFGLAESHRQEGNRSSALAEFKKFLALQSTGDEADIARRLVQELEAGR